MDDSPPDHNADVFVDNTNWMTGARRGFNTVELVLSDCSAINVRHFDTHGNVVEVNALTAYISGLSSNTVLVGVTADTAEAALTTAARQALLGIGVDMTQLSYRGKLAFIAQVGRPSATLVEIGLRYGNLTKLNAIVSRTCGELFFLFIFFF
jgi:hypothetical protein